jgi:pyridoxamine 5'-phosphate oxidase
VTPLGSIHLPADPLELFGGWLRDAEASGLPEPTAMAVATATADGRPSSRMVLLKEFGPAGFVFATNYGSRKAREIEDNPHASLLFYWNPFDRQVRIEGTVERVDAATSDAIFARRPRGARIGALASKQSQPLDDRATLERAWEAVEREHAGREVERPRWWGGYRVVPREVEFWEGRPNRLHDRVRYARSDAGWTIERLWP